MALLDRALDQRRGRPHEHRGLSRPRTRLIPEGLGPRSGDRRLLPGQPLQAQDRAHRGSAEGSALPRIRDFAASGQTGSGRSWHEGGREEAPALGDDRRRQGGGGGRRAAPPRSCTTSARATLARRYSWTTPRPGTCSTTSPWRRRPRLPHRQRGGTVWASIGKGARSFCSSLEPGYPNGIALSADEQRLYVADFEHGISIVDGRERRSRAPPPANVSLHGVDGLYRHDSGLIAVQNGAGTERSSASPGQGRPAGGLARTSSRAAIRPSPSRPPA